MAPRIFPLRYVLSVAPARHVSSRRFFRCRWSLLRRVRQIRLHRFAHLRSRRRFLRVARPIEIVLRRGAATLSGTVNLKDATRGAVVCLFSEKSSAKALFHNAGADGSFRFENLPPGDYRIAAVDSLLDVDFSNPASLKKISSAASEISLSPAQSLALSLDLTAVEE